MSELKQFKTESKRLLDLMINSIYTNKEIFLRELISNASDAIDKYHYLSLTDDKLTKENEYKISLSYDKDARTITIEDNGIGMTYDEVNNNLGTIAKSGSLEFLNKVQEAKDKKEEIDIIGQFGVGFYSSFMVADKVVVETKSPYADKGYKFTSSGSETYEVEECDKSNHGTKITLYLREDKKDEEGKEIIEDYTSFLSDYKIEDLVKKYSDYIRYPIQMFVTETVYEKDADGKETDKSHKEVKLKTLNSMIPLWRKNKSEVTEEQLNDFYKNKFSEYEDPLTSLFVNVEGLISYNALLFIPKHAPYNLYSEKYERGLQLYTKGVFIMDKCKDLIPDYLRFVKGLVDSSDLSLNISREMLQQNRQIKKIAQSVEKKILQELERMKNDEFDKYVEFFKEFGSNLKYGIYESFGAKKDSLKDLLIYASLNNEKMISLKQYVDNMKEGQEFIYYASNESKDAVQAMPQLDAIKKKGFDVLILTEQIDEFAIEMLQDYNGKKFKSISQADLDLLNEDEKKAMDTLKDEKKPLIDALKETLNGKVSDVRISSRLVDSPVCLVSGEGMSLEMEKVLKQMPNQGGYRAERILEINPNHELFKALEKVYNKNNGTLNDYASLLYDQALLMEGIMIENPVEFSNKMVNLMINSTKDGTDETNEIKQEINEDKKDDDKTIA